MGERRGLTLACAGHLSDRVLDLWTGAVRPAGIDLHYLPMSPREGFRRLLRGEFPAGEMSLSTYATSVALDRARFVAIPAFPSRTFRHSAVYLRTDAGIDGPADLAGRRIGVPEYQMTAAVWVRGMLQHDHGVRPSDVEWVTGGLRDPGRPALEQVEVRGVKVVHEDRRSLDELLLAGEIDAIVAPQAPPSFTAGSPRVRRLFADHRAAETDYHRRTGLFPIMHTVVLDRALHEAQPWVAASLYEAFDRARRNALDRLAEYEPLPVSLPWVGAELARTVEVMGADFWPYGLEPNEPVLDALCGYLVEQGLCERRLRPRELFAPSTLDLAGTRAL
ncbi:ABC transporter substrate-binding protein [Pseudonocardia kongjuensis]|uniref:ABC transporter substrate-binding protein n=1 Tax=Pseudonocardia kongjuensis TaxID=102227 RepID=A0ABN1YBU0_9PSEU